MHPINYSLCLFIICLHIEKLKIDTLRFILTKEQLFQEQHKSFRKEKKWCWKSYYSKHLLSLAFEVKSGMLISLQNMNSIHVHPETSKFRWNSSALCIPCWLWLTVAWEVVSGSKPSLILKRASTLSPGWKISPWRQSPSFQFPPIGKNNVL